MTLKLYGSSVSNYVNVVKTFLREKDLPFTHVPMAPGRDEDILTKSPMGKIPALETSEGFLSESQAIMVYLEHIAPEPRLFPETAFAAARARQIHQIVDLYLDSSCRPLIGAAFFGREGSEEANLAASEGARFAFAALARLMETDGFAVGDRLSHADIGLFWQSRLARQILAMVGQPDPAAAIPGFDTYIARLAERPAFARSVIEQEETIRQMMADR